MKKHLYLGFFFGGLFLGGGTARLVYEYNKAEREQEIYNKAGIETLDYILKAYEETRDTTKVVCLEFAHKKDTIHIPMWDKKIKTTCNDNNSN